MLSRPIQAICAGARLQPADRLAYRHYRTAILGMQGSVKPPPGERASVFRQFIVDERLPSPRAAPLELRMIRLALGLPPWAPLRPNWVNTLGVELLGIFLPKGAAVRLTITGLRATRTEEGRAYLYSQFFRRIVGRPSLGWYGGALRLVLTQVEGVRSAGQLARLASFDEDLLAAGLRLGLRDADALVAALEPLHLQIGAQEVRVLVEEQVIEGDFASLTRYLDPDRRRFPLGASELEDLRASIRRLKQAGVAPVRLIGLVNVNHFVPDRLEQVLEILSRHDIGDVATVFAHLGARMWSIEPDVLEYVLVVLGVGDAATLVRFTDMLKAYRAPGPVVAEALKAKGATPAHLATCQRFLVETGKLGRPALNRIDILMAPPYRLQFEDLDGCGAYLRKDDAGDNRFDDFLAVLAKHGHDNREGILAFGPQFHAMGSLAGVDLGLAIVARHLPAMPLAERVAWIVSTRGGHPASLRYLGLNAGIALAGASDLDKLADLAKVSPCLLRYLYEEWGLRTIARLHDWYHLEGRGVGAYHGGEDCDDTERMLFRDCSKRASFYRLNDNAHALVGAVSDWVDGSLARPGPDCTQELREASWAERASLREAGRQAAARHIDQILAATDGILLESVLLDGLGGADVATVLQAFTPLTTSLLAGRSTAQAAMTPLELECIRLVYGASQERIRNLWGRVSGFQDHLQGLCLAATYPVSLRLQAASLDGASAAVHAGLARSMSALAQAAHAAGREDRSASDLLLAAPWKHVGNRAATLVDLAPWLAFLLKLGRGSDDVARWTDDKLAAMQSVLQAPETAPIIEREFSQFITATLPDALAEALPAYLAGQEFASRREEVAASFAKRKRANAGLPETLTTMVAFVLEVAGRLPRQLRTAMVKTAVDESFIGHAVVSKDPSAFFARDAFELCSKDDTGMWQEARHSHLLIFDPVRKRLAGMAMLYVQPIPGYGNGQRCLVIRAVNVGTVGLRKFDPVSVLDETRRIAIEIAEANGLEAILFPQGSTHFSNQEDIVRALPKSLLKQNARPLTLRGGVFCCRELERNSDAVQELQLAWVRLERRDPAKDASGSNGLPAPGGVNRTGDH